MVQIASDQTPDGATEPTALDRLLQQAGQGDAEAWRELVDRYTGRVFGLLARQCGDRELAEELTQATFVKVVTRIDSYQEQGKFEPWLFRVAMNLLRDEMRRRKRQARPMAMTPGSGRAEGPSEWAVVQQQLAATQTDENDEPLARMQREEQIKIMQLAVRQLSEEDQKIIHLRHTAGLTFAQIAEMENMPLGTVLARGHRALGKLRKMLCGDEDD